MALLRDVLGLSVVGAESEPVRAELVDERQQRVEVAGAGGLADQHPHAGAQPLAALLDRAHLVIRADPRRCIGVQLLAEDRRGVPVDVRRTRECELRELGLGAGDDAGEVHHLGEADHPAPPEEALEVAGNQRAARRLELGRRYARRGHEEHVQREVRAQVREPVDTVRAQDVGDLVRVGDHRRRPEWKHEPRELVHEQLRGLEVHVGVDESGDEVATRELEDLGSLVVAEACDEPVCDREVAVEPLAGEDREDLRTPDDEVGRLVSPGDCEAALEVGHCRENVLALARWTC